MVMKITDGDEGWWRRVLGWGVLCTEVVVVDVGDWSVKSYEPHRRCGSPRLTTMFKRYKQYSFTWLFTFDWIHPRPFTFGNWNFSSSWKVTHPQKIFRLYSQVSRGLKNLHFVDASPMPLRSLGHFQLPPWPSTLSRPAEFLKHH